jgi:transposase
MKQSSKFVPARIIGMDVGDDGTQLCVLSQERHVLEEFRVPTRRNSVRRAFQGHERCRVVLEVGPHSRWIDQELRSLGHEVLVVDARRIELISRSTCKTDRRDARVLAQLGAAVPEMLSQVVHRTDQAQADLAVLHSRDHLVEMRTRTVLRVRGVLKSWGVRVPRMSTKVFHRNAAQFVPEKLQPALIPLLEEILELNIRIRRLDDQIEEIARRYPAVERLQAVNGVAAITSLAFVLAIDDPSRFKKSRHVGPWVGLCPRKHASGRSDPQLSITRTGNPFLRRLLVNAAHCVMARGEDCDLRHYGQRIEHKEPFDETTTTARSR